jgi:proteasome lid subunit RPN8/RPN11
MVFHVDQHLPEEACGVLAGELGEEIYQTHTVIPTTNMLHSPVRYRIAPQEQLAVFNQIEEMDSELVGIFHSHPLGPDVPSHTDIAEAYYPEVVYLIWSRRAGEWRCRGFTIQDGEVSEVRLTKIGERDH